MFDINNIDMILSITIAYFAGSLFLTIFFYNLYYLQKKSFLLKWVFAWLLLSLAYLTLFFSIYFSVGALYGIYSLFLISYGFMFLRASSSFMKFTLPRYIKHLILFLFLIIITLTIFVEYVAWAILIAFITIAIVFFIIGLKFTKVKAFFSKATGYIMIIFSILTFFYPYLTTLSWYMPWGYVVTGMLGFFIGVSLIQIHFHLQKEELTLMKDKLHYMAHHDSLTDVYNRLYMDSEFLKIEKDKIINIGLLFIDFNDFKLINDTYGHRKGDEILIQVIEVLEEIIKDRGIIIRFGGDEFIILLYNSTKEETNQLKIKLLEYSQNLTDSMIKINFAIGSAFRSKYDEDMYHLVDLAEKEMYINKNLQKT